jgi:hypothetical protein
MENYIDAGIGNYVVLSPEQVDPLKQEEENYFQEFWKMSFDGACSKYGSGEGIVFKIIGPVYIPMQSDRSFHVLIMN